MEIILSGMKLYFVMTVRQLVPDGVGQKRIGGFESWVNGCFIRILVVTRLPTVVEKCFSIFNIAMYP